MNKVRKRVSLSPYHHFVKLIVVIADDIVETLVSSFTAVERSSTLSSIGLHIVAKTLTKLIERSVVIVGLIITEEALKGLVNVRPAAAAVVRYAVVESRGVFQPATLNDNPVSIMGPLSIALDSPFLLRDTLISYPSFILYVFCICFFYFLEFIDVLLIGNTPFVVEKVSVR